MDLDISKRIKHLYPQLGKQSKKNLLIISLRMDRSYQRLRFLNLQIKVTCRLQRCLGSHNNLVIQAFHSSSGRW